MSNKAVGVLTILGASVMWAIEPILAKLSYQTTDFLNTFATRVLFCLLIITIYILVGNKGNFSIRKKHLPGLICLSMVATLFADLIYIYALTKVKVVNAVLIGHMQPIFIILLGALVLKEDKLTRFDYSGILFMILSGLLVTTKTPENLLSLKFGTIDDFYVLLATIAWVTTAVITRKYLKELPGAVVAFYRFLFAGVIFLSYMLCTGGIKITNCYQVFLGAVIGIGTILYYEGLRRIKAAQVSALELATPFFAAILATIVLHEFMSLMQAIGILSLFVGIYFLSKKENRIASQCFRKE